MMLKTSRHASRNEQVQIWKSRIQFRFITNVLDAIIYQKIVSEVLATAITHCCQWLIEKTGGYPKIPTSPFLLQTPATAFFSSPTWASKISPPCLLRAVYKESSVTFVLNFASSTKSRSAQLQILISFLLVHSLALGLSFCYQLSLRLYKYPLHPSIRFHLSI
jgi:hypothetical protein